MRFLIALLVLAASTEAFSFSYATGGCASGGCAESEQWLHTNANEIDTALDTLETNVTALQGKDTIAEHESGESINVILATEIATGAALDSLANDEIVTEAEVGTTLGSVAQAYDDDLTDLSDGTLAGSKIGTGISATNITSGTLSATYIDSGITRDTEIDSASKINALTTDDDFMELTGTQSLYTTGNITSLGFIRGGVNSTIVSATTHSPLDSDTIGDMFLYTSASGVDVTLPAAAEGLNACFRDSNGGGVVIIDAAAGDEIELDGTGVGVADAIDSPGAKGDFICLLAIDGTTWVSLGRSGTWVDGGAD